MMIVISKQKAFNSAGEVGGEGVALGGKNFSGKKELTGRDMEVKGRRCFGHVCGGVPSDPSRFDRGSMNADADRGRHRVAACAHEQPSDNWKDAASDSSPRRRACDVVT